MKKEPPRTMQAQWAWDHADKVYAERDLLIRALTFVWPAHLMRHRGTRTKHPVVCIQAPTGQLCWTLRSDDEAREHYRHLEWKDNDWDGHKTAERDARLRAIGRTTAQ